MTATPNCNNKIKPKIRAIFIDENNEPVDPEVNIDCAIEDLECLLAAFKETRDSCPECGEPGNEEELCSTCLPEGPEQANEDWRGFYADRPNPDGPRYLDAKPNPID